MDVLQILINAATGVWWIFPLLIIAAIIRLPNVKGCFGELSVRILAWLLLKSGVYRPHHNITLMMGDGSTQIDHIFVSIYGVFVVETKNMKGWIFGSEKQANWTQQIYKKKYKFQNPLRQNYRHTEAVKEVLRVPDKAIYSVVAFVGECKLKTAVPPNVTKGGGYIRYIKSKNIEVLSDEEVNRISNDIESKKLSQTIASRSKHVASLQERHHLDEDAPVCPRCQSALVRRERKKGNSSGTFFWGCSTFPKCRFTKNV